MNVPICIAAKIFKKDPAWVRKGIRDGLLPIGVATKVGKRYNYYISPKLLYEFTGVMVDETYSS